MFLVRSAEKMLVRTRNRGQEGPGASSDELGLKRLHGGLTVGDRRRSESKYALPAAESIFPPFRPTVDRWRVTLPPSRKSPKLHDIIILARDAF